MDAPDDIANAASQATLAVARTILTNTHTPTGGQLSRNTKVADLVSCIKLARNNIQLPTLHLSPYLNTDSLFVHGFPSFIQRSSSEQPSTHSLQSSCPTQMPLDLYLRIPRT